MTLDEAIKDCNEVAEVNENFNEEELSLIYADDTECIENHKAVRMRYAEKYRQIAAWLTEYKRLLGGNGMTVSELIEQLKQMPQDAHVYVEGNLANKIIFEKSPDGNGGIVRIFKAWDVEFVGREIDTDL